jgi:hypothetical protein
VAIFLNAVVKKVIEVSLLEAINPQTTETSTRSVQLGRSKSVFACFWVANRAARSTS